ETLRFSDEAPLLTAANRDEAQIPESSDMSSDEAPQMPEPVNESPPEQPAEAAADPNSSASLGSVVETYREKLQQDPAGTLNSLGVAPVSSSGAQGYRLDNIANSPYLAQTGLQPGD